MPVGAFINSSCARVGLGPGARHKAADLGLAAFFVRPHDGWPETIGLSYECGVRHINPFSVKAHTVVAVLCIPVHILDTDAIGKRAAQAFPTRELVEPLLERRSGKLAVVTCRCLVCNQDSDTQHRDCDTTVPGHC